MNSFTLYWKNGKREIIHGDNIEQAFTNKGYSAGAVAGLDWYFDGASYTHEYNKETKTWIRLGEPYKDFTVYWPNGVKEHLGGLTIEHALQRAGYGEHQLTTVSVWEEGITDSYLYFPMSSEWISREKMSRQQQVTA